MPNGKPIDSTSALQSGASYTFVFTSTSALFTEAQIKQRLLSYPNFDTYSVSRTLDVVSGDAEIDVTFKWNGDAVSVQDAGDAMAQTISGSFFSYGNATFQRAYAGGNPNATAPDASGLTSVLTNKYVLAGSAIAIVIVFAWAFGQGAGEGVAAKV